MYKGQRNRGQRDRLIVTRPKASVQRAKFLIERVKLKNDSSLSESQVLGLIETIVVYKFPALEREVIAKMLGIDVLKETRVYRDALDEGRQEGRQDSQLEALGDRFFDIETTDDLEAYLAEISPDTPSDESLTNQPSVRSPTDAPADLVTDLVTDA